MFKRQLATLVCVALMTSSSTIAHAQIVDKILLQTVSWLLQKQIDEMEKANDTSHGLKEYNPQGSYSSSDHFAPGNQYQNQYQNQDQYQAAPSYPVFNKVNETARPQISEQATPVVAQ